MDENDESAKILPRSENEVPKKDQICACGHSLERHVRMRNNLTCIERFCPCNNFKLSRIL
jgi:hypothetical protein